MPAFSLSRFDELAVFVEVAAAGSLAGAARRMRVPKSTVGRAIARVEQELGVSLVRRMARGHTLTEAGRQVAALAGPHVAALRDIPAALDVDATQATGTLRMTAPADIGAFVLAPLVSAFALRYPRIRVEMELTLRVVDLVREGFDLALRVTMNHQLPPSALVAKKIARIELGLYASAAYAARRGVPQLPDALAGHEHVLFNGVRGRSQLALEGPSGRTRVTVQGRISANDFYFVREAVLAGAGIGPLPRFLAQADVATGRLVRVLPGYHSAGTQAYVVHARVEPMPIKLQLFRDLLLAQGPALFGA